MEDRHLKGTKIGKLPAVLVGSIKIVLATLDCMDIRQGFDESELSKPSPYIPNV